MMNNRGQIGRIITSLPVLFLLFFLMGIFIALVFIIKGPIGFGSAQKSTDAGLLLTPINMYGETTTVFDAFMKADIIIAREAAKSESMDQQTKKKIALQDYQELLTKQTQASFQGAYFGKDPTCFIVVRSDVNLYLSLQLLPDGIVKEISLNVQIPDMIGILSTAYRKHFDALSFSTTSDYTLFEYQLAPSLGTPTQLATDGQTRSVYFYQGPCVELKT